jgi:hypothetical protein
MHLIVTLITMTLGISIKCHNVEFRYAECHYAECCFTVCHYARLVISAQIAFSQIFLICFHFLKQNYLRKLMHTDIIKNFQKILGLLKIQLGCLSSLFIVTPKLTYTRVLNGPTTWKKVKEPQKCPFFRILSLHLYVSHS